MISPQRDLVLVTLETDEPAPSSGGIILMRDARPASTYAHVVAIGPGVRDVRIGALVVISRLQGISIGPGQLVLPESAVLAQEPLPLFVVEHGEEVAYTEPLLQVTSVEKHLLPMTRDNFSDELLADALRDGFA